MLRNSLKETRIFSGSERWVEELTVVIPVFNQQENICRNLEALVSSLTMSTRIVIVDDASTDKTFDTLITFLEAFRPGDCISIELKRNQVPKYETACDYLGFHDAKSPYLLEVQADMEINDLGFDRRLVTQLEENPDLIAVSGRGTEPLGPIIERYRRTAGSELANGKTLFRHIINRLYFQAMALSRGKGKNRNLPPELTPHAESEPLIFPEIESFCKTGSAGRVGLLIDSPIKAEEFGGALWLGQTVMRGPLMIDRKKYVELGGFDCSKFFLGFDEHELFLKAYLLKGYRVGFTPVEFVSPLEHGSTRRRRNLKQELELLKHLTRIASGRKKSYLYSANEEQIRRLPPPEIRFVSSNQADEGGGFSN